MQARAALGCDADENRVCRVEESRRLPGLGPHEGNQTLRSKDVQRPLQVVGQDVQAHFRSDPWHVLVRKWVAPIHALIVPNGCSTVCRRSRDASGVRSSRRCMASRRARAPSG